MSKVLVITNNDMGLYNFRKELLITLLQKKHEVYISLPAGDRIKDLEEIGCVFLEIKLNRRGINPIQDMSLLLRYLVIFKRIKPDIVLSFTIKPNLYGGIASRFFKRIKFYPYIAGLGTPFQTDRFLRKILIILNRFALKKAKAMFYENSEVMEFYQEHHLFFGESVELCGAGVNLSEFCETTFPDEKVPVRFLFIGRIMKEKGIVELFEAAKRIKKTSPQIQFDIVGDFEEDFSQVIQELQHDGIISYHGFQKDVKPYIASAHCLILPSYHEGMANVLLESAAMGRPLIASNIHGCNEAICDGENGYLVKKGSAEDLYEKIMSFFSLPYETKKNMGALSRKYMETNFDRNVVTKKMITAMML